MHVQNLDTDVLMFRGVAYESIATAFIHGDDVLLVDALASVPDAQEMRAYLEDVLGKHVRTVVLTHGFADHRAGLALFPEAAVLAHPSCPDTVRMDTQMSAAEIEALVARLVGVDDAQDLQFGRHHLRFFHNEGKTRCSMGIEVPTSDLQFTADNLLGQIAYISRSTPELIHQGIDRLEQRSGSRLVQGHQGVYPRTSIGVVRHYLQALGRQVMDARQGASGSGEIAAIRIADCLPDGVAPTEFEREWHTNNLTLIASRGLFDSTDVQG